MKRVVLFLLVLLFVLPTGCQQKPANVKDDGKILIGYISESMTIQRWALDRELFVNKAEELGAQVIVQNAYEDAKRQEEIGREMIRQGVDVLVIVPWDKDSLTDLVRHAQANNVKVISYDRLIRNANVDLYMSFDNYNVGALMAKFSVLNHPTGNYVIINGPDTDYNCVMIRDGIMDILDPYIKREAITLVGETSIKAWRDEGAYKYVNALLSEGIEIDVIIAADDQLAEGAVNALSENRIAGHVYVTGQDAELAACQRIVEGTQHMTVYKPISVLAEGAAEIAVLMAKGEQLDTDEVIFDGTYYVPTIVYQVKPVNKDNMIDTIINDGFYEIESVYKNIHMSLWPKKKTNDTK